MDERSPRIVAVSGGVDSIVLLDRLVRQGALQVIVAHFDHGIRTDSAEDAMFVAERARQYGVRFEQRREELGPAASEAHARTRRYAFLRSVARRYGGVIVTAHHMNDVAETIAINLVRGTGWRGVAVLASDIERPLLDQTKQELVAYAQLHGLTWREDSTNQSQRYLRNRLRQRLAGDDDLVRQLAALRTTQVAIRDAVDDEIRNTIGQQDAYSRYFFTALDVAVARECLRFVTHGLLTRPQLERALLAIATYGASTRYQAGAGVTFHFTSRHFTVKLLN